MILILLLPNTDKYTESNIDEYILSKITIENIELLEHHGLIMLENEKMK